jgi:hypothetical protein
MRRNVKNEGKAAYDGFSLLLRSLAENEINSVGLYTFSDLLNLRTL